MTGLCRKARLNFCPFGSLVYFSIVSGLHNCMCSNLLSTPNRQIPFNTMLLAFPCRARSVSKNLEGVDRD